MTKKTFIDEVTVIEADDANKWEGVAEDLFDGAATKEAARNALGVSPAAHAHPEYEPVISTKNAAFNVHFGTVAGTAVEGTHVGSSGAAHAVATTGEAGFLSPEDKAKLDQFNPAVTPVTSVFGRGGDITALSGDYTAVQVGADAAGTASAAVASHVAAGDGLAHIATQVADTATKVIMTTTERTKVSGIETGAQVNPARISAGEIATPTETALRSIAPADLLSFVITHAPEGGVGGTISATNVVETTARVFVSPVQKEKITELETGSSGLGPELWVSAISDGNTYGASDAANTHTYWGDSGAGATPTQWRYICRELKAINVRGVWFRVLWSKIETADDVYATPLLQNLARVLAVCQEEGLKTGIDFHSKFGSDVQPYIIVGGNEQVNTSPLGAPAWCTSLYTGAGTRWAEYDTLCPFDRPSMVDIFHPTDATMRTLYASFQTYVLTYLQNNLAAAVWANIKGVAILNEPFGNVADAGTVAGFTLALNALGTAAAAFGKQRLVKFIFSSNPWVSTGAQAGRKFAIAPVLTNCEIIGINLYWSYNSAGQRIASAWDDSAGPTVSSGNLVDFINRVARSARTNTKPLWITEFGADQTYPLIRADHLNFLVRRFIAVGADQISQWVVQHDGNYKGGQDLSNVEAYEADLADGSRASTTYNIVESINPLVIAPETITQVFDRVSKPAVRDAITYTGNTTLSRQHADRPVIFNGGSAQSITVPASVFYAGDVVPFTQISTANTVTFVAGAGMTLASDTGSLAVPPASAAGRSIAGIVKFDTPTTARIIRLDLSGAGLSFDVAAKASPATGDKLLIKDNNDGLPKIVDWNQLPSGGGSSSSFGYVDVSIAPYNAACDGTSIDTTAVNNAAIDIRGSSNPLTLLIPRRCRLGTIDLQNVNVEARGDIVMQDGETITIGASSSTAQPKRYLFCRRVGDDLGFGAPTTPFVRVIGKNNTVYIGQSRYVQVYADGAVAATSSTAYNNFWFGHVAKVELLAINSSTATSVGWINENKFFGGRCEQITIDSQPASGQTAYTHNNNHFEDVTLEGSQNASVSLNNCSATEIRARFEGTGSINFSATTSFCVCERIYHPHGISHDMIDPTFWNVSDNGFMNKVVHKHSYQMGFSGYEVFRAPAAAGIAAWAFPVITGDIPVKAGDVVEMRLPLDPWTGTGGSPGWRSIFRILDDAGTDLLTSATTVGGDPAAVITPKSSYISWQSAGSWEEFIPGSTKVVAASTVSQHNNSYYFTVRSSSAAWMRAGLRNDGKSGAWNMPAGATLIVHSSGSRTGIHTMSKPMQAACIPSLREPQIITVNNTTVTSPVVLIGSGCTAIAHPRGAYGMSHVLYVNEASAACRISPKAPETFVGASFFDVQPGQSLSLVNRGTVWREVV